MSKGAVSYALNGRAGVSDLTRQRILHIAEQLGWQPNSAARALSAAQADAIGLAIARPARVLGLEPFFMTFVSGVESVLANRHTALLLQVVHDHHEEISTYRRWWAGRRVDGVIVVDLYVDDQRIPVLEQLGLPAVVVGGPDGLGSLPGVWSDDAAAMHSAVDYLVALGHKRIARVAGLPELRHTQVRTAALKQAMARHRLPAADVVTADYTGEEGMRATRTLLSQRKRPTAVIYDNDVMAVAALGVAQEMGLRVPDDVSIIAWDDSPPCQLDAAHVVTAPDATPTLVVRTSTGRTR